MSKVTLGSISATALLLASVALAPAADITTKKILIKDDASDTTKRQILVLSKDVGVTFASAATPDTGGASVHVYGSTTADDFCVLLEPGANWTSPGGNKWKYKNTTTKNLAQIKDGRLLVKIKQDAPVISYSLNDDGSQGNVNVQVQFSTGTRYCMRCPGNVKDDGSKFLGKDCAVATCDAEPSSCDPPNPTTTTSTSSSTTSTSSTTVTTIGTILKVVLAPKSNGRFNFAGLGLAGATTRCNSIVPGSTYCTYARLLDAEAAGELVGIVSMNGMAVDSFWAIDNAANVQTQCINDEIGGSFLNWEYATAHTGTGGANALLNNLTGDLGPVQAASCVSSDSVGCCQ
jgi:hypothetical protein